SVRNIPGGRGSRLCSCFTITSNKAAERFFLAILDLSRRKWRLWGDILVTLAPKKAGPAQMAGANRIEIKVQVTLSQADELMKDFSAQSTHLPQGAHQAAKAGKSSGFRGIRVTR
ncbi:MAG TPA: hypothetical protein VGP94_15305, partial [Tepidisphaeraceae bacterium]|nr:hypothetical protein [Tepidisphaeraceae bacterium]